MVEEPFFPHLTTFERLALESIAPNFGDKEAAFRDQMKSAQVIDRENTIHGFFTTVKVDRSRCVSVNPLKIYGEGGSFEVEGLRHGMGILLMDTHGDGYLETIEGFGYDTNSFANLKLVDLKFIRSI